MGTRSAEQLYRDLADVMTSAFPDRDMPMDIGSETRLLNDLGFASIELVVLGERLEQYFHVKLPYGPFLSELRNRGAEDLTLGELVAFLQQHL